MMKFNALRPVRRRFSFKEPQALAVGAVGVTLLAGLVILIASRHHKPLPAPPNPTQAMAHDERPRPLLSLSLNGTREAGVFRGWPLILEAGLFYPTEGVGQAEEEPFLIATRDGPWSNAVRVEVRNKSVGSVMWPLHLASTPSSMLSLHRQADGNLVWWLSAEDSAQLSEGDYEMVAVLDTKGSTASGTWKGRTTSVPVSVRLRNQPEALTAEQESGKYHLFAFYDVVRGDFKSALGRMEELLRKQPDNVGGLQFKGDALAEQGKTAEAFACYRRAVDTLFRQHMTTEPPRELLVKQRRMVDQMLKHPAEVRERSAADTHFNC